MSTEQNQRQHELKPGWNLTRRGRLVRSASALLIAGGSLTAGARLISKNSSSTNSNVPAEAGNKYPLKSGETVFGTVKRMQAESGHPHSDPRPDTQKIVDDLKEKGLDPNHLKPGTAISVQPDMEKGYELEQASIEQRLADSK